MCIINVFLIFSMGDAEYLAIFQQIILPMAYEFSPELVIVSAGQLFLLIYSAPQMQWFPTFCVSSITANFQKYAIRL